MKLLVYSDLHNEFSPFAVDETICVAADALILAGDIDLYGRGVRWAQSLSTRCGGKPVLMVAGNHEFYGGHFVHTLADMRLAAQGSQVQILENQAVTLHGVRFLGCTLWTDFALYGDRDRAMQTAGQGMTDYRVVDLDGQPLHPTDTLQRHRQSRAWLEQQLAQSFAGPTVVITHHAPSAQSIPPARQGNPLSPAYASKLDALLGAPVALWVHGHVHTSCDYLLNGTRIVCNPRGYLPSAPNPDFDPALMLTV